MTTEQSEAEAVAIAICCEDDTIANPCACDDFEQFQPDVCARRLRQARAAIAALDHIRASGIAADGALEIQGAELMRAMKYAVEAEAQTKRLKMCMENLLATDSIEPIARASVREVLASTNVAGEGKQGER